MTRSVVQSRTRVDHYFDEEVDFQDLMASVDMSESAAKVVHFFHDLLTGNVSYVVADPDDDSSLCACCDL